MDIKEALAILEAENSGFADEVAAERERYEFIDGIRRQLTALRKDCGVNQVEMGRRMEMSQSAISHFERGFGDIGMMTILRYVAALDLKPDLRFVPLSDEVIVASEPQKRVARIPQWAERKAKERRVKQAKLLYYTHGSSGKFLTNSDKESVKRGAGVKIRRSRKAGASSGRPKGVVKT
jgi:transcriptional regulator with XRE-family HTH domain